MHLHFEETKQVPVTNSLTCVDEDLGALVPAEMEGVVQRAPPVAVRNVQDVPEIELRPFRPVLLFDPCPKALCQADVVIIEDKLPDLGAGGLRVSCDG